MMDDRDKRTERPSASVSPNELALINQVRGQDVPMATWLREAAMERVARELGTTADELDTARRPAQRRRNYSERQQDGKQQGKGQQQ